MVQDSDINSDNHLLEGYVVFAADRETARKLFEARPDSLSQFMNEFMANDSDEPSDN